MNIFSKIEKIWTVRGENIEAIGRVGADGKPYVLIRLRVSPDGDRWEDFTITAEEWSYFLPAAISTFNAASKE